MKLICIGRNYTKHIEELQNEKPSEPVIFIKPDSSIILKNQPFFIPHFSNDIHHEIELIVRINKIGKNIQPEFAHKYYQDISVGIDFTARDVQASLKEKGLPWEKAKAFDFSALIGKWKDKSQYKSMNELSFQMTKNEEIVQQSSSQFMLWKIDELIAYVSQYFTLKIGDILFTGTPQGVGKVNPDDKLEGYLDGEKLFSINIK